MAKATNEGRWLVVCKTTPRGKGKEVGRRKTAAEAIGLCLKEFRERSGQRPAFLRMWTVDPTGKSTGTVMQYSYTEERR